MLTLICPTYNRHPFLERSCRFWCDRNVSVIYADGSESACTSTFLKAPNIHYLHYPVGLVQRLLVLLAEVKTPYVCMMGDDEFYILSALQGCVAYLDSHPDYVACMGRAIAFSSKDNKIVFRQQYPRLQGRILSESAPLSRLDRHFSSYVPAHCYAVTRTEIFQSSMEAALSIKLDIFAIYELIEEFLVVAAGKSIVMPNLYWLRSLEAPPLRNTGDLSLDPSKKFNHWWQSMENVSEKKNFCKYLSKASCDAVDEDEVEKVFNCYNKHTFGRATNGNSMLTSDRSGSVAMSPRESLRPLKSCDEVIVNQLSNPAAQNTAALQLMHDQGVTIDKEGLAECLASIKENWRLLNP